MSVERRVSSKKFGNANSLDGRRIFRSDSLRQSFQNLANVILRGKTERIKVMTFFDRSAPEAAWTDGDRIVINTDNSLSSSYSSIENRFICLRGLLFHELSHILYHDFNVDRLAESAIRRGELYGDIPTVGDGFLQEDIDSFLAAVQSRKFADAIVIMQQNICNIFNDVHDEDCMMDEHNSIVEAGIMTARKALWEFCPALEDVFQFYTSNMVIMETLLLQYARFGEFAVDNPNTVKNSEMCQDILSVAPFIRIGRTSDNPYTVYSMVNKVMVMLWNWVIDLNSVKEMTKEEEQEYIKQLASDAEKGASGNASTPPPRNRQSSQNAMQQSSQGREEEAKTPLALSETEKAMLQKKSEEQKKTTENNASSGSNSSGKEKGNCEQSVSKNGKDGVSGNKNDGENKKTDTGESKGSKEDGNNKKCGEKESRNPEKSQDKKDSQPARDNNKIPGNVEKSAGEQDSEEGIAPSCGNGHSSGSPENHGVESSEETAIPEETEQEKPRKELSTEEELAAMQAAEELLQQLQRRMEEADNTSEKESVRRDKLRENVSSVDLNEIHDGYPVNTKRELNVDDINKEIYEETMQCVRNSSNALQRQVKETLRDMKEGYTARHKLHGSYLDAKEAYRKDQRFYADKKQPSDIPDMAICVLVDQSGSMYGERIQASRKAAIMLHDFASGLGIPVMICGHNTSGSSVNFHIYTDYEQFGPNDRYRIAKMEANGSNRDGMALAIASDLLSVRPEQIKILIIISDGRPAHFGYSGEPAYEDIRSVVKKYRRRGVETFAAAIGEDKDIIKEIYQDSYLDITDLSKFPKMMVNLIKSKIVSSM